MAFKIHRAPWALGLDGSVLANLSLHDHEPTAEQLLERARGQGGLVFIGSPLTPKETSTLLRALDEASHEALAFILGAQDRRRRRP
jgi:hypothetical protein